MKKIFLFIVLTLFIPIEIFSQNIKSENKYINAFEGDSVVWKSCLELNFEGIENPISETILYGDTLINGIDWKIFNSNGIKGLIRTEDAKIIFTPHPEYEDHYYMHEYRKNETIIYDFSLEVGDSFGIGGKVIKMDSIVLNDGEKHKRLIFEYGTNNVEGLGYELHEPFSMLFPKLTMTSEPTLMCCHVNGELLYMNPDYSDCEGNKVANEIIVNDHSKVKISLSNGTLHIISENIDSFDVNIYNIQGILVVQQNKNYNEAKISLEGMPKGIYVVQIISRDNTYTHKIIK